MFIAALFTIAKIWEHPKWSSMEQKDAVHVYNGEPLSRKESETLAFVTAGMDPEDIILSEINQTEKDTYSMLALISSI